MTVQESDGFEKAKAIFAELVPERIERIEGGRHAIETLRVIQDALTDLFGEKEATNIAFHLTDWNSDVAFLTALHLFPERFTKEEIISGVYQLVADAPEHLAEAAKLLGCPVENIFERGSDAIENVIDHE